MTKIAPGSAFAADYKPQADWSDLSLSAVRSAKTTAVVQRAREVGGVADGHHGIHPKAKPLTEMTVTGDGGPRPVNARLCVRLPKRPARKAKGSGA